MAREHERGVADRLAARELHLVGAQDDRVAAELDDAGLERQPRARRGLLEEQRDAPAASASDERGAALSAAPGRAAACSSSRSSSSPVRKWRGKRGAYVAMRVLTWNLFHGRAVPDAPRELLDEFAAQLAAWAWDVALLQEVPPWWPPAAGPRAQGRAPARR